MLAEMWQVSPISLHCGQINDVSLPPPLSAVVEAASKDDTREHALDFFKREYVVTTMYQSSIMDGTLTHYIRFELDYLLAAVPQPYVAVMDGITSEHCHLHCIDYRLMTPFALGSGRWCWSLHQCRFQNSDGEYSLRDA